MTDRLSPENRSWNMSRIKSKDTAIEVKVRKYLYHQGYRYKKNVSTLPGKPDIVLRKYNTVVFIHGCFWHRHMGCKDTTTPKTRTEFWNAKFARNVANDKTHTFDLENAGWNVIVLWECEITRNFDQTMKILVSKLEKHLIPSRNIQNNIL